MFFSLSKQIDDRFPNHSHIGSWILNHDEGWSVDDLRVSKGLGDFSDGLGPWTRIRFENPIVHLEHAAVRGYPLWWDEDRQILTNLVGSGIRIWCDDKICLHPNQLHSEKIEPIVNVSTEVLDSDSVVSMLTNKFSISIKKMFEQTALIKKKQFVTGGVDSAVILALLNSCDLDFANINHEHFDYDWFTNACYQEIKQHHWAYNQIHHWRDTTILITGSCGDEFMMRGPAVLAMWCAWHDVDFCKILNQRKGYHVRYFLKPGNQAIIEEHFSMRHQIRDMYPTKEKLYRQICNMNLNDHQHWHLGNTFTWSPFHDIDITLLMLRLPFDELIEHFIDATINKKIIQLIDPKCLFFINESKNSSPRQLLNNSRSSQQ